MLPLSAADDIRLQNASFLRKTRSHLRLVQSQEPRNKLTWRCLV